MVRFLIQINCSQCWSVSLVEYPIFFVASSEEESRFCQFHIRQTTHKLVPCLTLTSMCKEPNGMWERGGKCKSNVTTEYRPFTHS